MPSPTGSANKFSGDVASIAPTPRAAPSVTQQKSAKAGMLAVWRGPLEDVPPPSSLTAAAGQPRRPQARRRRRGLRRNGVGATLRYNSGFCGTRPGGASRGRHGRPGAPAGNPSYTPAQFAGYVKTTRSIKAESGPQPHWELVSPSFHRLRDSSSVQRRQMLHPESAADFKL